MQFPITWWEGWHIFRLRSKAVSQQRRRGGNSTERARLEGRWIAGGDLSGGFLAAAPGMTGYMARATA